MGELTNPKKWYQTGGGWALTIPDHVIQKPVLEEELFFKRKLEKFEKVG